MAMAYKDNWAEARPRLEAWWQGEVIDRPCIAVTAPGGPRRTIPPADDFKTRWTDPDYVATAYDAGHEATFFGGEAVPGTSLMVGYCFGYGAPLHYSEQTVWQEPTIDDWDAAPPLVVDEEDWAWKQIQSVVARCAELAAGKWMVGWPNIHQPNDHLSLLRGAERLLLDMIDRPGTVKRAMRQLLDNWYHLHQRIVGMLSPVQEGSITWLPVWCPHPKCVTLQSDVSCNLSPAMFNQFIAAELEEMADYLDAAIYHLDGPGALQHLDRLLAIDGLRAIQWTAGTGQAQGLAWLELFRRIQSAGKGVVISLPYDEVLQAVRELRPEGLFIMTSAPSPEAAEGLLAAVAGAT